MKVISMIRDKISFGHDINNDDSGDEDDDRDDVDVEKKVKENNVYPGKNDDEYNHDERFFCQDDELKILHFSIFQNNLIYQ